MGPLKCPVTTLWILEPSLGLSIQRRLCSRTAGSVVKAARRTDRFPEGSPRLPQYRQRSHCHLRNKAQSVILTPDDSKHVPSQQWSGSEMDKVASVAACQDRMHWKRTCSSVCSRPVCGIRSSSWTDSVWDALIDWMLDCSNFCQCGYFIIHMLHTYPSN